MNIFEELNKINDDKSLYSNKRSSKTEKAQSLKESKDSDTFYKMKQWVEDTNPTEKELGYEGPYSDYINYVYGKQLEKYNKDNNTSIEPQLSIENGRGASEMFDDEGGYASHDYEVECQEFLDFVKDADTFEEFEIYMYSYIANFADEMEYYDEEDEVDESLKKHRCKKDVKKPHMKNTTEEFVNKSLKEETGSSLLQKFMIYHEDPSNHENNKVGFDKMYDILSMYGTEDEDVDKVFIRASEADQKRMVDLITPQLYKSITKSELSNKVYKLTTKSEKGATSSYEDGYLDGVYDCLDAFGLRLN